MTNHTEQTDTHHVDVRDAHGRKILTVGALRAILADFDDLTQVVIATDGWYSNIHEIELPAKKDEEYGASDWSCVTLFTPEPDDFDARQF